MGKLTNKIIKWSIITKTTGIFIQILASVDYFVNGGYAWPWLLITGVVITNLGGTIMFKACRRAGCKVF